MVWRNKLVRLNLTNFSTLVLFLLVRQEPLHVRQKRTDQDRKVWHGQTH